MQALAARWALRRAARRARREAAALHDAPRFRITLPFAGWRREPSGEGGRQVFRAFVQINVLPRTR